jgi:PleD family two-component response regulator
MRSPVATAMVEDSAPQIHRKRVARVLLADTAIESRLALKTILSTAGYAVSGAATAAEAIGKLDENEYQLVLADLRAESEEAGPHLLAYARQKEFHPATALISSDIIASDPMDGNTAREEGSPDSVVHISNENVFHLLDRVAELISRRADRRISQAVLRAS